ncbi:hypothetical protein SAMN05444159_3666 [Bradyrhizobium lablabi]|uniref:Antibiotic biosynthesis monooxygenase n=1 Tax=Bradyrhizobium lablabi TaxID=722472 RepID=A0A1M6TQW6_9BRAD|nr:hypothetical protein [Bradyrhizobium lablabi]SHK59300.1 hypothetical protein SAMN05444159_3666 [Bradyrhizobium lablabi]
MLTITAVIRAKKGHEDTMRQALLQVAENVRINEPNTIGFFVSHFAKTTSLGFERRALAANPRPQSLDGKTTSGWPPGVTGL